MKRKILALLIPAGLIAGVLALTAKKAKADEQKPASPGEAGVTVDATEDGLPVVVPSYPVTVPAPVVSTVEAGADSIKVGPGSINVTIPSGVDVTPVSPDVGENETETGEVESIPSLPQVQLPSLPVPGVSIQTPAIDMQAPDFSGGLTVPPEVIAQGGAILSDILNLPKRETKPDSVALVKKMLAEEGSPGWKYIDPLVAEWQRSRGLKVDGKAGPSTNLQLAKEAGMAPLVRWWPLGKALPGQLSAYRTALRALATKEMNPNVSADLVLAADRESGQSYRKESVSPVETVAWEPEN